MKVTNKANEIEGLSITDIRNYFADHNTTGTGPTGLQFDTPAVYDRCNNSRPLHNYDLE